MSWIGNLFRTETLENLDLMFELDLKENTTFLFRINYQIAGERYPLEDLDAFLAYGFTLEGDSVRYVVGEEDKQKLAALRSVGAAHDDKGMYASEIVPPVLAYLRRQPNVEQTETLAEIEIHTEPLKPDVVVDYDPKEGVSVEAGYRVDKKKKLVPQDKLEKTPDGGYIRLGKAYYPIPREESEEVESLLKIGKKKIAVDDVPEFFLRDLVLLRSEFNAVLTDRAEKVMIIEGELKPRVTVGQVEGGWLDFQLDYEVEGYHLPADLIRRAKNNLIPADDYHFIHADTSKAERDLKALDSLDPVVTEDGYRLPAARFASLEEFIEGIGGVSELSAEYQAFLESLVDFKAREDFKLPDALEARLQAQGFDLRPYQRAGIHWLDWLRQCHLHGVLADDMGLGKTLESLVSLRLAYENEDTRLHSLIICPKSVIRHWSRELQRIAPKLRFYEYHGSNRQVDLFQRKSPIIFISTYSTVRNDIEKLQSVPFFYLILDEATRIKNPDAGRTQAVKRLNAAHRVTLTGTPVENRPQELWSLFDFLMRGHLGRYGTFERLYAIPILQGGNESVVKALGERIGPFVLRRTKEEVAKDLPEKIEMDEWCELTEEQRSLYGQILEQYKDDLQESVYGTKQVSTFSILPILTKLKQVCDHPAIITGDTSSILGRSEKFDLALEKMEAIKEEGEQVILFSHFLSMLDLFEMAFNRKSIDYIRIDGGTQNRQAFIDRFDRDGVTVLLCSLMAMSHGVNLQSANHVIHVDRWWNPAVEDQATDRVHRIGQDKTVYVYRINAQGTLEERIDRLQSRKRQMAGNIVDAATEGGASWTREELMEILRPLGD